MQIAACSFGMNLGFLPRLEVAQGEPSASTRPTASLNYIPFDKKLAWIEKSSTANIKSPDCPVITNGRSKDYRNCSSTFNLCLSVETY
jgi:hypothetical protein